MLLTWPGTDFARSARVASASSLAVIEGAPGSAPGIAAIFSARSLASATNCSCLATSRWYKSLATRKFSSAISLAVVPTGIFSLRTRVASACIDLR